MAPPSLESAKATLEAALDVFNGRDASSPPPGGRTELKTLGEKAKQAASRAALLASGGSAPSPEEISGVVYGLEQSTIAICSYTHGFTHGSGPSLKASLKQRCSGLVEPTQELVAKLMAGPDACGELRNVVGKVWAAVDELTGGPIDNKGCLFRKLADVMAGVKSAAKELEELVEESKQELAAADHTSAGSRGSGAPAPRTSTEGVSRPPRSSDDEEDDAQSSGGEADEDDFRDMGHLSAGELAAAEAAAGLLAAAQEAMRAVSRPLLEGPEVSGSHCLDEWESMAWHAEKLRSSCEGLVACLYPPHEDFDELQGTAESVSITLELLLSEFPEAYAAAPAGAAAAGAGAGGAEAAGAEGQQDAVRAGGVSAALEAAQRSVDAAAQRLQDALSREAHAARTGVAAS